MFTIELKIYGKVANLKEDVRLVYLEGMLDYIELIGKETNGETKYICDMHNYLAENGTDNQSLSDFYDSYKERG